MKPTDRVAAAAASFGSTLATLAKVALRSRPVTPIANLLRSGSLVVMGNGPSLRHVLDEERHLLEGHDLMAVNFAPNTEEFFELRPQWLVLADPHFFRGVESDANVRRLWERLGKVDWPLTLCVAAGERKLAAKLSADSSTIEIITFNTTPGEGWRPLRHWLYGRGLAMPRPRNVLIAALMTALRLGYRKILVVGADHSWMQSLWVDERNRVVSVQPHFYKDNEKELDRVASEYAGYHLHDILRSLTVAFSSYFLIADYADAIGAEIINCTPGSYIDAFPRGRL